MKNGKVSIIALIIIMAIIIIIYVNTKMINKQNTDTPKQDKNEIINVGDVFISEPDPNPFIEKTPSDTITILNKKEGYVQYKYKCFFRGTFYEEVTSQRESSFKYFYTSEYSKFKRGN